MTKEQLEKFMYEHGICHPDLDEDVRGALVLDIVNDIIEDIKAEPNIADDGTLTVSVEDGTKVSRVLVCGDNHFGGLYYPGQEPKTGHWIAETDFNGDECCYRCSRCNNVFYLEVGTPEENEQYYCPTCGVKME